MSDGSEERPQTKMIWYISTKTRRTHRLIHVKDLFKVVKSSRSNNVRLNKFVQMRKVLL